jgi:hypothetical protein
VRAAQLPEVQSSKFELVINLQTVKTLGLGVPPNLRAGADVVIIRAARLESGRARAHAAARWS